MNVFIIQQRYDSLHLDPAFDVNPPQNINSSEIHLLYSFRHYIKGIITLIFK